MTEEEKKELQELRDMKELQELRKAKATMNRPLATPPRKTGGGIGCGQLIVIFIVAMVLLFIISAITGGGRSTPENHNDNSQYHQILAKNYFKDYLKEQRLKDPDSYDEISYTSVYNDYRKCYVVDLKFRARNSFGGMVIERWMADVKFENDQVKYDNIIKLE